MGSTPTFGTIRYNGKQFLGAWLSLVERSVRVAEVGGSNPLAPTKPAGCNNLVVTAFLLPCQQKRKAGWRRSDRDNLLGLQLFLPLFVLRIGMLPNPFSEYATAARTFVL